MLDSTENIPVYDATSVTSLGTYDARYFGKITLPRWKGEIPRGSCALVAYSIAYYYKRSLQQWKVYANIQWVIVLGKKIDCVQ
ncbi:hypothetical protein BDQ17DRAFT_1317819 [Cyathus striatus]|nr:hypothetical protein BDQ17DRAFT_1317819 [Cyathus striatus]